MRFVAIGEVGLWAIAKVIIPVIFSDSKVGQLLIKKTFLPKSNVLNSKLIVPMALYYF